MTYRREHTTGSRREAGGIGGQRDRDEQQCGGFAAERAASIDEEHSTQRV